MYKRGERLFHLKSRHQEKLKRSHEYLISKNSLAGMISFVFLNRCGNAFLELAPLQGEADLAKVMIRPSPGLFNSVIVTIILKFA